MGKEETEVAHMECEALVWDESCKLGKSEEGAHTDYESPWVTKVSALGAGVEAVMATQLGCWRPSEVRGASGGPSTEQ